jgi:hypothetical protein
MNTLIHPSTAFIQSLETRRVLLKELSPQAASAACQYIREMGKTPNLHTTLHTGEFALTADARRAIVHASPDLFDDLVEFGPDQTFNMEFTSHSLDYLPPFSDSWPVVLNHSDLAPEFGFFADGYQRFMHYWLAGDPSTLDGRLIPFLIID